MKSLIAFTIFVTTASAQELKGPSAEDLMAVSFNFMEESKKVMEQKKKKDCDEEKEIPQKKIVVDAPMEEMVCLCDLPQNLLKDQDSFLGPLIGNLKETEINLTTGNDNFLHGVLQRDSELRKFDGDDRGRTFNIGSGVKLTGTKGELELKVDSVGFGKFNTLDGYSKDSNGKYFLNYHEVNTMDLRWDKFFNQTESGKMYSIGEFNLTHRTDDGKRSLKLQEWWHDFNKEKLGMNVIRYHYLKEVEDKTSVTLMTGIGKEWISKLDNWKCISKAEIKAGMTLTSTSVSPEIAAKAGLTLSHSSVKWIALSAWTQAKSGFMGKAYEGGMTLSFPYKTKNLTIEPFIGLERHKTSLDKKYGSKAGNPYENYHVLGVTIKY